MNAESREIGVKVYPGKEKLPEGREIFVVMNRFSRKGEKRSEELLTWFKKQDVDVKFVHSRKSGHTKDLVSEIVINNPNSLIVVVGGDGTCSEAINGALVASDGHCDVPFLFYPAGTGNDIAHALGHDKKDAKASILKNPKIERVDALKMTITNPDGSQKSVYGLGYIGFGVSAAGARKINEKRPSLIGHIALALDALRSEGIDIDLGGREESYREVLFLNGSRIGKVLNADSTPTDGKFDLFLFQEKGLPLLEKALKAALIPQRGIRRSELEFTILNGEIIPQVDAEPIEETQIGSTIKLSVLKNAISVVKV